MATYAIGDIHGDSASLDGLLDQVEPLLTPGDVVVFLGDYVDRGPDSKGVLDRVLALRGRAPCPVRALLGNHEEWLLRTLRDGSKHSWILGMEGHTTVASYSPAAAEELLAELRASGPALLTGEKTLPYERFFEVFPAAHLELLQGLETYVRTPDVVCVHGGAESGRPVEEQEAPSLVWGPVGFPAAYEGPDVLVYGHRCDAILDGDGRVQPNLAPSGLAYGIDSSHEGVLACLRFPDLKLFQSPGPAA